MNQPDPSLISEPAVRRQAIDWQAVLENHCSWMRAVIQQQLHNAHATEEVLQEICVAVLEQPARPDRLEKIGAWLYQITIRHAVNHQRSQGRTRKVMEELARQPAPAAENPRDWVIAAETRESVVAALDQLELADRQLLLWKYTEGWTYRQLAEHFGVTEKAVEYRLLQARKRLRGLLSSPDQPETH